jgi:hypothetical protein
VSESAPTNPDLVRAIQELFDAPTATMEAEFRAVLKELLRSTLIVAEEGGDPVSIENDDGEVMLALFTDLVELHMFDPGSPWSTIKAEAAIRLVADDEFDGIIINPRGRSFELAREDIVEIFEID